MNLTRQVLSDIEEMCTSSIGYETGGILLGYVVGQSAMAWWASGPGPAAVLRRQSMSWDVSYIAGILEAAEGLHSPGPIGRWHKHVAPIVEASEDDRAGARAFREAVGLEESFELIVATGDGDRPIAYATYLCTEHEFLHLATTELVAADPARLTVPAGD